MLQGERLPGPQGGPNVNNGSSYRKSTCARSVKPSWGPSADADADVVQVADIFCNVCNTNLGWKYEMAFEEGQKYKVRSWQMHNCYGGMCVFNHPATAPHLLASKSDKLIYTTLLCPICHRDV